jgi:hypothetical protein
MGLSRTGNIGNDWKSGPVSSSLDRRAGRITSMNRRTFLQTAGLSPHSVKEKYYFARFQQRVNRVVDIAPWVERKIDLNLENKAQGPAGENGQRLRARLEAQGQRLPLLGSDDAAANRNYIREFVLQQDRITGQRHGLTYAERFHYIGPPQNHVEEYLRKNAISR